MTARLTETLDLEEILVALAKCEPAPPGECRPLVSREWFERVRRDCAWLTEDKVRIVEPLPTEVAR